MVQRVHLSSNPPRLITSKAGKNATPTMADADKSFDSDWFDGGGLKWILTRNTSGDFTPFPYVLNYIPYVWPLAYGVFTGNQNQFADMNFNNPTDRPPRNSSRYIKPSDFYRPNNPSLYYRVSTAGITLRSDMNAGEVAISRFIVMEG